MLGSKHRLIVTIDNPNDDPAYVADVLLPDDLSENQAMALHHAMAKRFGWAGTYFTRGDCEQYVVDANGDYDPRPLTDAEWAEVQRTFFWRRMITDVLTERGWDIVNDAVYEVLKENR